jgi:two-component system, NarL family, sensor histidine kinase BarA
MAGGEVVRSFDDLTVGKGATLEELVDREALGELTKSFYELFRVPLRIYTEGGGLLAESSEFGAYHSYLNSLRRSRARLQEMVTQVKAINPGVNGEVSFPCVSGAVYRIISLTYDSRQVGRLIMGPFMPPGVREVPAALLATEPELDPAKARALLVETPRAREDTIAEIGQHLRRTLDLILFSGHKALLTSQLHLASVREGYRNLQEKNEKLQEAYERLKELDRLKSNFLATVSHELRTPLTSIIGYSEMLVEGIAGDLAPEQREFAQTIRDKGEQLLSLIKGLLDLSKLESGTMSLRRGYVDLGALLQDVHQTMAPQARKKGVELGVQVDQGLPMLWADGERLRQVLLNLLENAIKFTPRDGRVVVSAGLSTMSLAPGEDDGTGRAIFGNRRMTARVRVADTGIGIPVGERDRVFDAFYQVDSSSTREQGGTGLGLSIVRRLVLAHDGSISIEDNQPRGAVFVVDIPYRRTTMV